MFRILFNILFEKLHRYVYDYHLQSTNEDWVKNMIKKTHDTEDIYNKEIGLIDKQLILLNKRKKKLTLKVSKCMKYRNKIINLL